MNLSLANNNVQNENNNQSSSKPKNKLGSCSEIKILSKDIDPTLIPPFLMDVAINSTIIIYSDQNDLEEKCITYISGNVADFLKLTRQLHEEENKVMTIFNDQLSTGIRNKI